MGYSSGGNEQLFGAIDTGIYSLTTVVDPDVSPAPVVSGTTNGYWNFTQFGTTGDDFLIAVNGSDPMQIFDGDAWYQITNQDVNRINFDAKTSNFTVGATVTGGTSGATAVITSIVDNGSTGWLIVGNIIGTFQDNEIISGGGGSATVNGTAIQLFVGITFPGGLTTSDMIYVWSYKGRLYFIRKNSLEVYYLPPDAVGGTATLLSLTGNFPLGGFLMFGSTWSLDNSGDGGLSEQIVFVTNEGEVCAFQGVDPASASTWQKVGLYRIGKPLGSKAFMRAGGDLVIATTIGFVPLSQALQKDVAALSPGAVSYPIETSWNDLVSARISQPWSVKIWPENQMVSISVPTTSGQEPIMLITNARTGAWSMYTGWDGNCLETFQGRLFFGSQNGKVIEANVGGNDQGSNYTATYVPLFDDLGTPASLKSPKTIRIFSRGPRDVQAQGNVQVDYVYTPTTPPQAPIIQSTSEWGSAIWGQSTWGGATNLQNNVQWCSTGGLGYALAPEIQITSGSIQPLDVEIIRTEILYLTGQIIS
ncbi:MULTISPECIES: hypothetical protein [unclassified Sinorhizobium]|uniref:hypothetical protein n=1 Tax=unclassified Sinorhizobium TaxID=2613772 RepID=UPI0035261880